MHCKKNVNWNRPLLMRFAMAFSSSLTPMAANL